MRKCYPRLRTFREDGHSGTSDAVVICFYMQQHHRVLAGAVLRALEVLRERIRPHTLDQYITYEGQFRDLDDSGWGYIREEMHRTEGFVGLRLTGERVDTCGFFVEYRGLPLPFPWPDRAHETSVLFVRLPTEYLEERGPAHVRVLALEMSEELPFNSGYVDVCLCNGPAPLNEELRELVRTRYPGIHVAEDGVDLNVDTWVDGVHWLNFLGPPVLGKLGGLVALREHLAPAGMSLQEMPRERVLVTLSEWPEVGDVEAAESLPMHRALARVLEPYLYHRKVFAWEKQEQLRWERRFLE